MILGVLQARVSSTRLPGKVLLPVLGEPMIARQIERVRRATMLDGLVVATSIDPSDHPLAELCHRLGVDCFRGSLDDVLERFLGAVRGRGADHIVRLTGDCPLADPGVIDDLIRLHLAGDFDYSTNAIPPTFPDGLDAEAARISALQRAGYEAASGTEREHVTQYLVRHPEIFTRGTLESAEDYSAMRWTVDERADLDFVREVYAALYPKNPAFSWRDVHSLLAAKPELSTINTGFARNEGLAKSEADDRRMAGGAPNV